MEGVNFGPGSDINGGMNDCWAKSVPHSDSSYETFARPMIDWRARLTAGWNQSVQASDQTLGHWEERIPRQTQGLKRQLLRKPIRRRPT